MFMCTKSVNNSVKRFKDNKLHYLEICEMDVRWMWISIDKLGDRWD